MQLIGNSDDMITKKPEASFEREMLPTLIVFLRFFREPCFTEMAQASDSRETHARRINLSRLFRVTTLLYIKVATFASTILLPSAWIHVPLCHLLLLCFLCHFSRENNPSAKHAYQHEAGVIKLIAAGGKRQNAIGYTGNDFAGKTGSIHGIPEPDCKF